MTDKKKQSQGMSMLSCCSVGGGYQGSSPGNSPSRSPLGSLGNLGPAFNSMLLKHTPGNPEEVTNARRRTCTLMDIGSDARVTMLPWIIFTICVFYIGLSAPGLLQILSVVYGFVLSSFLLYFSMPRNWRWTIFSIFCYVMLGIGATLGLLIRDNLGDPDSAVIVTGAQIGTCFASAFGCLLLMFFLGWLLPKIGCGLVGSSIAYAEKWNWGWNGRVAQEMLFGCARGAGGVDLVTEKVFPRWMAICLLLKERNYWSGEAPLDYMFDLANNHTLLGIFLCHPVNPYEKKERLALVIILIPLIVFPCALVRQFVDNTILQTIIIAVCATLPRKILEAVLKKIALIADKEELGIKLDQEEKEFAMAGEDETQKHKRMYSFNNTRSLLTQKNALRNEVFFFVCAFLFVLALGAITIVVIGTKGHDVWENLVWAAIGLDFAVLLELCFGLIMPHLDDDHVPHFGFFGQWYAERKVYTPDTYVKNDSGIFGFGMTL
mmetsp:Transcript_46899/g.84712  ORF Transcript_46899/g.84712 Transcript_46899/m.84712 type:complete len:491 (+) Transcript_46899:91-1563(+)